MSLVAVQQIVMTISCQTQLMLRRNQEIRVVLSIIVLELQKIYVTLKA